MGMEAPGFYGVLADALLLVHALFVFVVVLGLVLILLGGWRGWIWTRQPLWRWLHLLAIVVVVAQSWAGIECPLTTWESALRRAAGQSAYSQGFIADWVGRLLFYRAPDSVFVALYSVFGLLVAATFYFFPPRRRRSGSGKIEEG